LVARAARTAQIVTVDNVREAPDWLPNPLLPDTYAEMAVPIVLDEQVAGVLDVQEDEIAGLDESDAALLRSLANQVAVAIRNARQFKQVETALTEAHAAQEKYIEQTWEKSKIRQQGAEHLHLRTPTAEPLPEIVMTRAKQLAKTQKGPAFVSVGTDDAHPNSIVAPVTLSGQTIGVLQVHEPDATGELGVSSWTDEDLALIETVLDQVAQTAETLRLFDETRERAGREQIIREITDKLRAAPTLEQLVKDATTELGQRLSASVAELELGIEVETSPSDDPKNGQGDSQVEVA
jgi:putative methionine-R-sulfoxide reductase with GAF domain